MHSSKLSANGFRFVLVLFMVVGIGVLFLARGDGKGQGVDLFTEDLASAGIDPAAVIETDQSAFDLAQRAQAVSEQELVAADDLNDGTGDADVPSALSLVEGFDDAAVVADDDEIGGGVDAAPGRATSGTVDTDTRVVVTNDEETDGRAVAGAVDSAVAPSTTPGRSIAGTFDTSTRVVATNDDETGSQVSTGRAGSNVTTANNPQLTTPRPANNTTTPDAPSALASQAGEGADDQTIDTTTTIQATNSDPQTTTSTPTSAAADDAETEQPAPEPVAVPTGPWCQIEVRTSDGVIRWDDDGKTAVFRQNDRWFHTPDAAAQVVLIPETINTNDDYVLRLWGGGTTTDVVCTFAHSSQAVAQPVTTQVTNTPTPAAPEVAAVGGLPTPITVPGGPVQVGFSADVWGTDRTQYWNELEATPGTGRFIAHEFKSFTKEINTNLYRWHLEQGRDLLLTWNGTDAEAILNGSHDEWIREHARELRSLPGNVMLRFWHEPDVNHKRAWIDNDPQQYIDSWMYVRQIFVEEQAQNIEWVWCPTAWNWNEQGARYYPGDANVDWICSDGYSGWDLNAPLTDIADAYTDFQAWANQRPHKPILIAEFGAGQRGPGERAEWVHGIDDWVSASPSIRAVVYFDIDMRPNGEIYDWRLRTEPDAWNAMLDVISSAPFGR